MIDPSKLVHHVLVDIEQFNEDNPSQAVDFATCGSSDVFRAYCEWNGICNYAADLEAVLDSCREAEVKAVPHGAGAGAWSGRGGPRSTTVETHNVQDVKDIQALEDENSRLRETIEDLEDEVTQLRGLTGERP